MSIDPVAVRDAADVWLLAWLVVAYAMKAVFVGREEALGRAFARFAAAWAVFWAWSLALRFWPGVALNGWAIDAFRAIFAWTSAELVLRLVAARGGWREVGRTLRVDLGALLGRVLDGLAAVERCVRARLLAAWGRGGEGDKLTADE